MRRQISVLIILFNCLLITSQASLALSIKVDLSFRRYPSKHPMHNPTIVKTRTVSKRGVNNTFFLMGRMISDHTLAITQVNCTDFRRSSKHCAKNSPSSYLLLEHIMEPYNMLLKIEWEHHFIRNYLGDLASTNYSTGDKLNLTCTVVDNRGTAYTDKPKDINGNPLSTTSLFAIIFLSVCAVLVFGVCFGWFGIIYYRQFEQYRMKKKLRKALAKSTQQMLDKSPIIIFDSNDHTDDEPTCAICLEIFKNKEKLRKLVCSHCFHISCIDPWLLSHQNCPLCNRNILRSSIPSISSSIMVAINEHNNDETSSIASNHNQAITAQNSNW